MAYLADVPTAPRWLDREAFPFRSRWLEIAAGRLHYVDEGRGPPILFVHGTPTWSFEWRHLIRALRDGYRCIGVDHLGFGLSDRPRDAAYTLEAHADRLRAFVERLGLTRLTLVAHDFGGPIALPLAEEVPSRIARLVMINSWMWSLADDPEMRRRARILDGRVGRILYRRFNFSLRRLMPGAYGDRRKLTPAIFRQYLAPFRDPDARERVLWPMARALTAEPGFFDRLWRERARLALLPALVIWGLKDRALRPRHLARWEEALPQAALTPVADAGHWPHEEAPGTVLGALQRFLAGDIPRNTPVPTHTTLP
jgi:haloalkane dehalogenase